MRRIVHYYPDAMGHSGVTFALWSWARAQAASGYEVRVLHASEPTSTAVEFVKRDEADMTLALGVPHRGRHRLASPVSLDKYLGRNDLLVLHEGWVLGNLVAAAAARRAGVPYVVMPHGVYDRAWTRFLKPPRWLRDRLERWMLERAAAVHVFFESEGHDIAAIAPRARLLTVPTGFAVPSEQWTGGGGYLSWIGRIDPTHKGLDLLVGAVARVPRKDRPRVCIRGYDYADGVARLRDLIDAAGVRPWVDVQSGVSGHQKSQFMRAADGYVHPSRWECHSIALLENLALGVPCLVSDRIHIAPTLRQSRAAILASPSEDGFARVLQCWERHRDSIAVRGRELVSSAFNWNTLMPRFQAALGHLGLH